MPTYNFKDNPARYYKSRRPMPYIIKYLNDNTCTSSIRKLHDYYEIKIAESLRLTNGICTLHRLYCISSDR